MKHVETLEILRCDYEHGCYSSTDFHSVTILVRREPAKYGGFKYTGVGEDFADIIERLTATRSVSEGVLGAVSELEDETSCFVIYKKGSLPESFWKKKLLEHLITECRQRCDWEVESLQHQIAELKENK